MKVNGLNLALVITVALVLSLTFTIPLENVLSEYGFVRVFPWYVPWRVAAISFIAWVVFSSFMSSSRPLTIYLTWATALLFSAAHYAVLYLVAVNGAEVSIFPMVYVVNRAGCLTYKLDLAQVVIVASLLEHYFTSRTSPRGSSGTRRTP